MAEMSEKDRKTLELMRKRFQVCMDAEGNNRARGEEDIRFAKGEQWPDRFRRYRELQRRPCLTINRIPSFIRYVVNDARQNKIAVKVLPTGDGANEDTAEVFQGMIRSIERKSDAPVAYDTALESAARSGVGYFRLVTKYVADKSFVQELCVRRIRNRFSVFLDPSCETREGSDAKYGFISDWMNKDEFEQEYGLENMGDFSFLGDEDQLQWMKDGKGVRIAEYFSLEKEADVLVKLSDGAVMWASDFRQGDNRQILDQRKAEKIKCIWRKVTGSAILEESEFPAPYIPIFRVIGDEYEIDGEVEYHGMVRDMRDSARMYNYWASSATEMVALTPKAPYIGVKGSFEGVEREWANHNTDPRPYLEYNPIDVNGNPAPPPQRQDVVPIPQGMVQMAMLAADEMKAIPGIYDPSLGAMSNEQSGRAILARQRQSDKATFHYVDNLALAVKHLGRVLVAAIPRVYDTPRTIRIIGDDENERDVPLNQPRENEKTGEVEDAYRLDRGTYDVAIAVGPSYSTRRLEAQDSMMAFAQAVPQAGGAIMDLVAESMDWPGAEKIAERLKKMLPPGLAGGEEQEQELSPEMVQQIVQQALAEQAAAFEASLEKQKVDVDTFEAQVSAQVDRYKAMTDRMEATIKAQQSGTANQADVREMVAQAIAELINQPPMQ